MLIVHLFSVFLLMSCEKDFPKDQLKNTIWEMEYSWVFSNDGKVNLEFKMFNKVSSGDYKGTYTVFEDQVNWVLESKMESKYTGTINGNRMSGSMSNNFGNYGFWSAVLIE